MGTDFLSPRLLKRFVHFTYQYFGTVPYDVSLLLQQDLHRGVSQKVLPSTVIALEHPPVITLGQRGDHAHLRHGLNWYQAHRIHLHPTDRGGEVTAHEPGQLVIYPIMYLGDKGVSVRKFIWAIEEATRLFLQRFNITAERSPRNPGIWVKEKKIASIGIRIARRASYHGVAINICNSLELFQTIVPCGLSGIGMTSVQQESGPCSLDLGELGEMWAEEFSQLFRPSAVGNDPPAGTCQKD